MGKTKENSKVPKKSNGISESANNAKVNKERKSLNRKNVKVEKYDKNISGTNTSFGKINPVKKKNELFSNYSENIVYRLSASETGQQLANAEVWKPSLINNVSNLRPENTLIPFRRRITAITWNSFYPHFVAFGTKGGEVLLMNFSISSTGRSFTQIDGIGPAGLINSMKFHQYHPNLIYTACLTGQVMLEDFEGNQSEVLCGTGAALENWFCSLDVVYEKKMILAGDCKGQIYFINSSGGHRTIKIHSRKILHIEVCHKDSNLIATSSLDTFVKLWDLRMMSSSKSEPLVTLPHKCGVNSVYFSPSNCYSLLTTDQKDELRVYSTGTWNLKNIISHPHRQFQHLSPIKASWHPLEDIIVVGRFPLSNVDPHEKTVDFFDAHTGKLLYRTLSAYTPGISPLNYFNHTGETLVSGVGRNIVIWKNSPKEED